MNFRQILSFGLHFLLYDGFLGLALAVGQLVWLRGLAIGTLLSFGLPPFLAAVIACRGRTVFARRLAATFLVLIGVGDIVAHIPTVFPHLQGRFAGLSPAQDRLLAWYTVTYCLFPSTILPVAVFIRELRAHCRREPARISRFTCVLGLFTASLMLVCWPPLLGLFGFWPIV